MFNRFAERFIARVSKWLLKEKPHWHAHLSDYDRISYEVRPADVILVEGNSHISNIIKKITQSAWSHAALYVGRLHDIDDHTMRQFIKKHYKGSPNDQLVIESFIGQGTIISNLKRYTKAHVRICRPVGLSRPDAQLLINYAIRRIGMSYSIRHVLDLARFLVPWSILPRRWRSSLFEHKALKPTEEICSAMIARAFMSVQFPLLPEIKVKKGKHYELIHRNPRLFTPSDFDYSPFFAIIKYPIFRLEQEAHYRQLPWKTGYLSDDKGMQHKVKHGEHPLQTPDKEKQETHDDETSPEEKEKTQKTEQNTKQPQNQKQE